MTLDEALERIELEPEYIQTIYDNGFVIDTYSKNKYADYRSREGFVGKYHFTIKIPVMFLWEEKQYIIEWNDGKNTFLEGVFDANHRLDITGCTWRYIASRENMSIENMEKVVKEGRELQDKIMNFKNDVKETKDKIDKRKIEEREQLQREERLLKMTPEKRKRAELEEKVFNELSKTLIFKTKMEEAEKWGYDSPYQKEFEDWVVNEVDWRVNNILENKQE